MSCCDPRLIYRTHRARRGDTRKGFTETDYARFLDAAHQQLDGPVVLVWDGLNTHTSRAEGWRECGDIALRPGHIAASRSIWRCSDAVSFFQIIDLLRYTHRYGLDFDEALAASSTAYTEQRLREEGPFQAGQGTGRDAILVPSATRPFRPISTSQGVVTSGSDAEWLLVRTAARVRDTERRGHAVSDMTEDIDDKQALSAALAAACSLSSSEVLDRLEPRISARAEKVQRAVEAAAQMGRAHGLAGVEPYCPLDADGDDSRLMAAFGETEPTTHANAAYRLALANAYTDAYKLASATSGRSTVMPTEQTGRDFPHRPVGPVPSGDAASAADRVGHAARAQPRRSRRGLR